MGRRLTQKDKDQIERWIGTGPKTFTLLYAITRDGCNAKVFHEKCDDQGPTVTVLYNTKESIYGGYSPIAWNSSSTAYGSSTEAFLFQLYLCGNPRTNKFQLKRGQCHNSVYNNASYGPTFGGGHDLNTFNNSVTRSDSFFPLNGSMNYGNSYEMQGHTADDINNGNLDVIELEVYKVAYDENKAGKPWRDSDGWDIKELEKLKDRILTFKPVPDLNFSKARIALIGPVGAGKSSFFNTIDTIFLGRMSQRACSGSAEQSITSSYIQYSVRAGSGGSPNVLLCDTPGIEESAGLDVDECAYLLDGHIPNYHQFNQKSTLTPAQEDFEEDPHTTDNIHCV